MDYKNKYEQALKKAKDMLSYKEVRREDMEYLFPELKESEDDRVRSEIIAFVEQSIHCGGGTPIPEEQETKWITWLEKQGEQKPADVRTTDYWHVEDVEQKLAWSEEDEKMIQDIINDIAIAQEQVYCKSRCEDEINWLKSLRPQNWAKEDKERYISCLQRLSTGNPEQPETINSKWFKEHVYPQSTWKPSDEHYELEEFAKIVRSNLTGISKAVQELFEAKYLQLTGNKMYQGFKD